VVDGRKKAQKCLGCMGAVVLFFKNHEGHKDTKRVCCVWAYALLLVAVFQPSCLGALRCESSFVASVVPRL